MEAKFGRSILSLKKGDITRQDSEAIVNAANSGLMGGGGVDGAIHRAGGPVILEECKKIRAERGPLPPGKAVITTGGNLKAKYVIHTVGPIWHGGTGGEPETLASAYRESLILAVNNGIKSISFPSISTGAYGYPLDLAAQVALKTVISFMEQEQPVEKVSFVLFSDSARIMYEDTLKSLLKEQKG